MQATKLLQVVIGIFCSNVLQPTYPELIMRVLINQLQSPESVYA